MRHYLLTATILLQLLHPPFSPTAYAGELTLSAVGDIMLAGSARRTLEHRGYSFPFEATSAILKGSHIAVGNLEAPITSRGSEFTGKRFRFRSPPEAAQALRNAGFSVLTLANNHILDYGPTGLQDTLDHLEKNSIRHSGVGKDLADAAKPAFVETAGGRVAFLSYSLTYPSEFFAGKERYGTAPGHSSRIGNDIRKAARQADYVVVSFHWGRELESTPRPYQVNSARRAIDAGADIVLGHHPHVLQGIERYRNGLIFYSLGNFAFGSLSGKSDRSIIARISLNGGVKEAEIIPLNVLNREVRFQPVPLGGTAGGEVIDRLNRLSAGMGTRISLESGRYLVQWNRATAAVR